MKKLTALALLLFSVTSFSKVNHWNFRNTFIKEVYNTDRNLHTSYYDELIRKWEDSCRYKFNNFRTMEDEIKVAYRLEITPTPLEDGYIDTNIVCNVMIAFVR
jgi:hypothetical protein